ncbi:nucleotide-diphospho-sugar transferase [Emticicia sp.]|uniref:nucleotide-diphospho-sugar transferase n=1 Tax=Emticicia sp. TaxID=1930953 RepID=UPI0037501B82
MINISENFHYPILFIIFNKVESTQKVFNEIRKQQPQFFFIVSDGHRSNKNGEKEKVEYIRNWVLEHIDWDCDVKILFREQNVGCGRGPSEAITWFFEHVEEGIILEDDCLPNDTFFKFCSELLEKYRDNLKISAISGNNFQLKQPMEISDDYYYSIFPSSWGWATWKRSWDGFQLHITGWKDIEKKQILDFVFKENKYKLWWKQELYKIEKNPPQDMWDCQFHLHSMKRRQYAIIPKVNLVSNIGFGEDSTHFNSADNYLLNRPTYQLNFPLKHPFQIKRNYKADIFIQNIIFGKIEVESYFNRIKRFIKRLI